MSQAAYVLHKMRRRDIGQIVAIDRVSFPTPWSSAVYHYEVAGNTSSQMVTLSLPGQAPVGRRGLSGWLDRLRGRHFAKSNRVVGYGGFWFSRGEAHVSTIAVHPGYREQGLGELLLLAMIRRGVFLRASFISLEVRVSNTHAINLYHKYGFSCFGVKHGYYRDNGEDAYDMRVVSLDEAFVARLSGYWDNLHERIAFVDHFTMPEASTAHAEQHNFGGIRSNDRKQYTVT